MLKTSVIRFRIDRPLRTILGFPCCSQDGLARIGWQVQTCKVSHQSKLLPAVAANSGWLHSIKKSVVDRIRPSMPKIFGLAATKLYYQCANGIPFLQFIEQYRMKDSLDSWMRITVLHIWLVLLRLSSEKPENYMTIRTRMLESLWADVEGRLKCTPNVTVTKRKELLATYYEHLLTSFLEYDEGFLGNDKQLAGALYRCLYNSHLEDPVVLGALVRYVRSEAKSLFDTNTGLLMTRGVPKWSAEKQLEVAHPSQPSS